MPKRSNDNQLGEETSLRVPRHVAIIMDGNGRWARRRFLPRIEGHRSGTRAVKRAIESAASLGVRYLTLYTFSIENWERPQAEVKELMRMLREHLLGEEENLLREGIRLRIIGERSLLPQEVREALEHLESVTAPGQVLDLTLAISYGSRQEMAQAAFQLAREVRSGALDPAAIDERLFEERLLTAALPPVDLLIRTSGERRLSNFLMWQARSAHLHFTPTLWPDFNEGCLHAAIAEFSADRFEGSAAG